jgi:hypothetical protein
MPKEESLANFKKYKYRYIIAASRPVWSLKKIGLYNTVHIYYFVPARAINTAKQTYT